MFSTKSTHRTIPPSDEANSDGVSTSRDRGEHLTILRNINEGGIDGGVSSAIIASGSGMTKGHIPKVAKGNLAPVIDKVLDDPLSIIPAERRSRVDVLGHSLSRGHVLDDGRARRRRVDGDGRLDHVTRRERDAGEIAGGIGVPFVPRCSVNKV